MICTHQLPISFSAAFPAAIGLGLGIILVPNMFQTMSPSNRLAKVVIVCLKCGGKNAEEFKFCGHCGNPLYPPPRIECPKCGLIVPSMKFCENCGTKLKA